MKLYDNDSYRDEFMNGVYALLSSDPTNDRANQIIDLFDLAPAVDTTAEPPNTSLTLEELREMDGEPVWVIVQSYATYWNWRVIRRYIEDHDAFSFYGAGMLSCCDYGKIWTAYRRKPEEE